MGYRSTVILKLYKRLLYHYLFSLCDFQPLYSTSGRAIVVAAPLPPPPPVGFGLLARYSSRDYNSSIYICYSSGSLQEALDGLRALV
jgi:hypothetical protein